MYRSREDIIDDILTLTLAPIPKTRIMIKAVLSYPMLKKYLSRLLGLGLLEAKDTLYITSSKGKQYLWKRSQCKKLLED